MELKECPVCGGDGECVTSHRWTCYDCEGTGKVTPEKYDILYKQEMEVQKLRDANLSAWEYRQMGGWNIILCLINLLLLMSGELLQIFV